ncbi:MAG: family 78 glycoside hydrolase catalytic domain, partial [Humibacter sp.]
ELVADFGQNLVGWAQLKLKGKAGDTITVNHAEVLDKDRNFYTENMRNALQENKYILSGYKTDLLEPHFTFQGFRYVKISGYNAKLDSSNLTAIAVYSDMAPTGKFATSNPLLNQLQSNIQWGQKGNFVDVPTDCPQRDERLGWTGDIAVFAPSAAFLFDVADFLRDWLRDLALEQSHAGGIVPLVVPDALKHLGLPGGFPPESNTAIWSDAAVWVPWALWTAYGDRRTLEDQWPSMVLQGRSIRGALSANGVWDTGFQFGDWLDPDAPPHAPQQAKADPSVVATLCAFRTASVLASAAEIVGDEDAVAEFTQMAVRVRGAFLAEYVDRADRIRSDCTTVYALAIVFGILGDRSRARAGDRLAKLVADTGYRISTGFAGTPYIADALTETGHVDAAYRLILQTECPSWLYPVTMGATTIWERWDSKLPDGTINPGEMTSFNHYALGAVVDWLHRVVGGISPLDPGYERILIAPRPGGDLTWARTALNTRHGAAAIHWNAEMEQFSATIVIPAGATAVLDLPGRPREQVGSGTHHREYRLAAGLRDGSAGCPS